MLDPVAELGQHLVGHVVGELGHEEHAHALGADEAHGLGHLGDEVLGGVIEEQVGLVEEEDQLGPVQVAHLGQLLEQAGEQPHEEGGEQAGPILHLGQLQAADHAATVGRGAQQVVDRQLGFAEEELGVLLLQLHHLAEQDPSGLARQAADRLQFRLAVVAHQVAEQVGQVGQVEEGEALLVGVVEHQRQRRALGLVGAEHLGQQVGAERADGGPHRHAGTLAAEGPELHRRAGGGVGELQLIDAGLDLGAGLGGLHQPGQIAFDVGREHRHALRRELLGQQLQRDGLAGAGGTGDEAVAVAHGRGHLHHGRRMGRAGVDGPPDVDGAALDGVAGGDPGGEVGGGPIGRRLVARLGGGLDGHGAER